MDKGAWSANTSSGELVPANIHRGKVAICSKSTSEVTWLAFGEAAVVGSGLFVEAGGTLVVDDLSIVCLAINGITASGTAAGGYQEA